MEDGMFSLTVFIKPLATLSEEEEAELYAKITTDFIDYYYLISNKYPQVIFATDTVPKEEME
jgi:hypothetical protein